MFVQVVRGKTKNPDAMLALGDKWQKELRPGATGYLGSTVGAAPDGTFLAAIQFTDDVAAKANSDRPEQDAFFNEMKQHIDGEPSFSESSDTSLLFDGPSEKATFVQVMESTVKDRAKAEAMENDQMLAELRKARPDLLGGLRVWLDGGKCLEIAYFTNEADARKGESSEDFGAPQEEFMALYDNMTYLDLPNPQINLA
jgi:hypothetical protein